MSELVALRNDNPEARKAFTEEFAKVKIYDLSRISQNAGYRMREYKKMVELVKTHARKAGDESKGEGSKMNQDT